MSVYETPYARTLGIQPSDFPGETPVILLPFDDSLLGRPGLFHGGAIAGLLAIACDGAVERSLGPDRRAQPITTNLQYLRAGRPQVMFAAATLSQGRKVLTVNGICWQDDRAKPIASICRKYVLV